MQVTIHGPLTITRISSYISDYKGASMPVHALTMADNQGCEISHHVPDRATLRRIAAPHMLGSDTRLLLEERGDYIRDRDLIRRWINGDDLAFAGPVASPMEAGAAE